MSNLTHDPYGERILAPLSRYYSDRDVVEVRINRPQEVILDVRGKGKAPDSGRDPVRQHDREHLSVSGQLEWIEI